MRTSDERRRRSKRLAIFVQTLRPGWSKGARSALVLCILCPAHGLLHGQAADSPANSTTQTQDLQARVQTLEQEVAELKALLKQIQPITASTATAPGVAASPTTPDPQLLMTTDDRKAADFLRGTTINLGLDTYYAFNFNPPVGRVNLLRAYDVLSNEFSLNQASVVIEHAPDPTAGGRWGGRLDFSSARPPTPPGKSIERTQAANLPEHLSGLRQLRRSDRERNQY